MDLLQALALGVVQGATEFLPISSSGHLVITPAVFGWEKPDLAFDVLLHVATLAAVVVYFRHDLWRLVTSAFSGAPEKRADRRLAWLIVAGTIPTGIIGLAFSDTFEALFSDVRSVGFFLIGTAVILTLAERLSRRSLHEPAALRWWHAVLIGVAQGAAIAPGISRSGATIAAGLGVGLDREQAARFSFLLSTPIILLTGGKTALEALTESATMPELLPGIVGFTAAAVTGYLVIDGLLAYLRRRPLYPFAAYCAVLGSAVVIWQTFG